MKSKTKIEKQTKKKSNPDLVETVILAKKDEKWMPVANILSGSRRNRPQINLSKINELSNEGEVVVVPGKVLSEGVITKKIKIVAFSFSKTALDKLKENKIESNTIVNEIKKNPKGDNIKILK